MSECVTKADYARRKNWNRSTVTRLVQSGRLVETADGKIDVAASEVRYAATESRDDMAAHHAAGRGDAPASAASAAAPAGDPALDKLGNSLQAVKLANAKIEFMRKKAEYEKYMGQLIEKEAIAAIVTDVFITFRQSLEGLRHRAGSRLVMKDHDTVQATLTEEVYEMLASLERDFSEQLKELTEGQQS